MNFSVAVGVLILAYVCAPELPEDVAGSWWAMPLVYVTMVIAAVLIGHGTA